jgi:hypothetical protein
MIEVELRVLCVRHWGFAEQTRRLTMPFPPCNGLVLHQGEDESRSELVASVGWLEGEGRYLCRLADDCALDLDDEEGEQEALAYWLSRGWQVVRQGRLATPRWRWQ